MGLRADHATAATRFAFAIDAKQLILELFFFIFRRHARNAWPFGFTGPYRPARPLRPAESAGSAGHAGCSWNARCSRDAWQRR
ncbi:MAG: hypothetical protein FJ405_19985 [Verrucomicrobia bacterium]|nr:hypothetical protein [Verrucomicrobiota bacterium]